MRELPLTRRIVTANDGEGQSYIAEDGPTSSVNVADNIPGFRNNNIWRTLGCEASIDAPDTIEEQVGVMPPRGGTVIRVVDIPPEPKDPAALKSAYEARKKSNLYPDMDLHPSDRHPAMHTTDTVDYAIVLHGEITAVMEKDETVMKAGDILIQRGTNHAWANRSDDFARIAFVLVESAR
ncbi:MAG: cupin domain-containing protein [Sphingopyxis macrogoltabida]|uniref:Cupin domain-containing protein n=1 Tax=Sphingopyxis macrogoltabida TaxID=33050 RepID=A0A2W5LCX8_SPHMC|nr:MAG: cupin domain-containing protein [Sphingopyxis macrogoltabida]